jgi:hypothetical protein
MWPFDSLAKFFHRPSPEERTRVEFDDTGVRCVRPDGRTDSISWNELQLVAIETNDAGPYLEDFYYYLEGSEYGFYIPNAAQGHNVFVRRLQLLAGFDDDAFGKALGSTENARFVCWKRGGPAGAGT